MILRNLLSLWQGFESALLKTPPFPMIVPSSNNLVIILWVETKTLDSLSISLFWEIKMSYDPTQ